MFKGQRLLHHRLRQGRQRRRRPRRSRDGARRPSASRRSERRPSESGSSSKRAVESEPSRSQASDAQAGRARRRLPSQARVSARLLRAELARVAARARRPDGVEFVLERPRDPAYGDWATNLAMVLAKPLRQQTARARAERSSSALRLPTRAGIARPRSRAPASSTSGSPATRSPAARARSSRRARLRPQRPPGSGCKVNVEFVSANPTGPLHVGHGRQARAGRRDRVAARVDRLARSPASSTTTTPACRSTSWRTACRRASARLRGEPLAIPEGGYHGEYIREIAASATSQEHPTTPDAERSRRDAARSRVRELREGAGPRPPGVRREVRRLLPRSRRSTPTARSTHALDALVARGQTYENDGALWLRTTDYGDDKDRVMRKATAALHLLRARHRLPRHQVGARLRRARSTSGAPTTTARSRACAPVCRRSAWAFRRGYPEYVLVQMVKVMRGGEEVKISKRAGQLRHRARSDRRGRARRGALLLPHAEGRLAARLRRGPGARADATRIRSSTSRWRTRA